MSEHHAICNPAGSCCTPKVGDDGRRGMSVTEGELHRIGCPRLADPDILFDCDCDGPTVLADLRDRLAAAIEALEPPPSVVGEYGPTLAFEAAQDAAARIVRERP